MNNKIIFSTIAIIVSSTLAHADSVEIKKCNTAYEKKDYIDALDYCRAAAKLKNPTALHKLGLMAELGQGSKEDYPQAMQYYKQSAKMGNLDAYYNNSGSPVFNSYSGELEGILIQGEEQDVISIPGRNCRPPRA